MSETEESDTTIKELEKKIKRLESEISRLKENDYKLSVSISKSNKDSLFWNKVIGISSCVSTILMLIRFIISK